MHITKIYQCYVDIGNDFSSLLKEIMSYVETLFTSIINMINEALFEGKHNQTKNPRKMQSSVQFPDNIKQQWIVISTSIKEELSSKSQSMQDYCNEWESRQLAQNSIHIAAQLQAGVNVADQITSEFYYLYHCIKQVFDIFIRNCVYYEDSSKTSLLQQKAGKLSYHIPNYRYCNNHKICTNLKYDSEIEKIITNEVFCYFPANRFSTPFWHKENNRLVDDHIPLKSKFFSESIEVTDLNHSNFTWITNIIIGSLSYYDDKVLNIYIKTMKAAIDYILTISCNWNNDQHNNTDSIVLALDNKRYDDETQLKLVKQNKITEEYDVYLPSLQHLSLGQSLIFNTFVSIIRHADHDLVRNEHRLREKYPELFALQESKNTEITLDSVKLLIKNITGMVCIDEIDAHLHIDAQFFVLPKLISIFSKVQFIITSHSPIFIRGMEEQFKNEYAIYELPYGKKIGSDRFSEYEKARDHLKLVSVIEDDQNHVLLVEGKTDEQYLTIAARMLDEHNKENWRCNLLGSMKIFHIGGSGNMEKFINNKGMHALCMSLNHKIFILFDYDSKRKTEQLKEKFKQHITDNKKFSLSNKIFGYFLSDKNRANNNIIRSGIEILLSKNIIIAAKKEYPEYFKKQDGEVLEIMNSSKDNSSEDKKSALANYIRDNGQANDFKKFDIVFCFLKEQING
jgi:hypothetical protein